MPSVSVIVPTKNSTATLGACLRSIRAQTHPAIELIVVDNHSTDGTMTIARGFTDRVYTYGPERSSQRNFGAAQASGDHLLFIDSDMVLAPDVVRQCVEKCANDPGTVAVVIPEESFGIGFWAQCKRLERSFYVDVNWMEAARFFRREVFVRAGGYDESMVSGEDWDLSQRIERTGALARIPARILHDEGCPSLGSIVRKKLYYARWFSVYARQQAHANSVSRQTAVLARYGLFFRNPARLFSRPALGIGMLFMKTIEFGMGAVGYAVGVFNTKREREV